MQKYITFLDRFKWPIVILIPLLVLILATSLKNLAFEGDYRIWFAEDAPVLQEYDRFRQVFGNDVGMTVAFRDEAGIFTPKALKTIDTITQKMWQMQHVARVDSLTNFQYVHASKEDPDDIIVDDFIQHFDDANTSYLQERREIAVHDRDMVPFVSRDGKTTMILARLTPKVNDNGDKSFEIMAELEKILEPIAKETGYRFWLNGGPPLTTSFVTIAQRDGSIFTPLVILTVMLLLYLLFRRISGALIPLGVVVLTFLTVLSIQVLLGYKLNNFTANIPVFIVAIGIADAVHVYIVWLMYRREGKDTKEAVLLSMQKNMLPIFLTSMTTAIGFGSLAISKVVPVATLGIATASGAVLAFLISVFWMPAVLLLLKREVKPLKGRERGDIFGRFGGYGAFIVKNDRKIIAVTGAIFLIIGAGLFRLRVDSNTIRYFDESVEIRKSTNFLQKNLTGPMAYEIVVDSGKAGGIKDPLFLKTVEQFYEAYESRFPDIRHISSLMDVVKRFNEVMNGSYTIPDNQKLIAQYLLLYSLSLPQGMEINDRMDIDERLLRVSAQVNIVDTSKDLEMIRWAEEWWSKTPYHAQVNGQTKMFAHMQKDVTDTLIYSMSLAIVLVSLVMLLIFRSIRLIWIFLVPNLLPIALVLGVMGWLGINIDLGVAVSGAIILGVAVDDTIHFLVKYFEARKRGYSIEEAFDYVLKYAGQAILFTTIVLSVAFSVFIWSEFVPNFNFGIVTATALILALIVDLILLPALLSVSEKREKGAS